MHDAVMGDARIKGWEVSHEITRINMTYPEIQALYTKEYGVRDITPGIFIRTSDVGDSAISVYGTFHMNGTYVITESIIAKHTKKNLDTKELINSVDEKIFFNHRKLPELLCKLIGREAVDYTKPTAFKDLCDFIEDSTDKLLGNVLPKRHLATIKDAFLQEFSPDITYTLYDIAMSLMSLSERMNGIDDDLMISVRKALSKAPVVVDKKSEVFLSA